MAHTPRLTTERLYASPALSGPSPRAVRFSPDGRRVTFLRPREEDLSRHDLWQFDARTGESSLLVDSSSVDPDDAELPEEEKALRERRRIAGMRGIADYAWGTSDTILVPAGGDLYLITLAPEGPKTRQLTQTEAYEYDARVSPGGRYVSFIRDEALYAIEIATGEAQQISPPARPQEAIRYGVAEFVAQEEMSRYTGYWWSPDERYIAFTEVDESGVDIIPRFDIEADQVRVIDQRYPRAGRPNARVSLLVRDMTTGQTRTIAGFGPDNYLARVNWTGSSLWFQSVNREQTEIRFNRTDGLPWRVWSPFTEVQPHWVNLSDDFRELPDGRILTTHESDGYRHIYLRDPSNGAFRQITDGAWVVSAISGFDADQGLVYFTGFRDTPLEQHLYSVPLPPPASPGAREGDGAPEAGIRRLTEAGGSWAVTMSPDADSWIGTFSSPRQPPRTGLYNTDGSLIAWVSENRLDQAHPYHPYLASHTSPEFGTLKAEDGQLLYYSLRKPPDFDPALRYPVIVEVYGGPHVQTVRNEWGPVSDVFYTHQGFIVFRLDNRGSWNRGKAFEDVIYRRTGDAEVRDQLTGIDWLRQQDFVDTRRIFLQGWSYGGYMTLMTLAQAPPGIFAGAIAGAPVTDWSLYDTFYTERYLDTPQDNPEGYVASSVSIPPKGPGAPLLLVHGMADDNVTFDNTTRLIARMQEMGQMFELMTYPGQRHGIRGEALQVHLMRSRMSFIRRHDRAGAE